MRGGGAAARGLEPELQPLPLAYRGKPLDRARRAAYERVRAAFPPAAAARQRGAPAAAAAQLQLGASAQQRRSLQPLEIMRFLEARPPRAKSAPRSFAPRTLKMPQLQANPGPLVSLR